MANRTAPQQTAPRGVSSPSRDAIVSAARPAPHAGTRTTPVRGTAPHPSPHRPTQQSASAKTSPPQDPPLQKDERRRNQRLNIIEGALVAAMTGLTANFLAPFALVLGASSMVIAFLATLPPLVGALVQLWVQRIRTWFTTRRQHMFVFSLIQALLWLPLPFLHLLPHPAIWLVGVVTLSTAAGFLIGPVWISFTADIVEEDRRGRFFGIRNTCTGIAAFVATLFAGLFLTWLKPTHPLLAFGIIFLLAFLFRLASSMIFRRMGAPPEVHEDDLFPSPHKLLLQADKSPFGKFTLFLMIFYIAVDIASPFFVVYQLDILGFSYLLFTGFACVSAVSSFVTMFFWGRYVDSIGARRVLLWCGLLIPIVPFAWAVTTDLTTLVIIEALSGILWAGFTLSTNTYLFDATDRSHRTKQVSEYTLLIQIAMFIGAVLGGWIIGISGAADASSYTHVFFLSAILRLAAVLVFLKVIKELRVVEVPIRGRLFRNFVSIRPQQGAIYQTSIESTTTMRRAPTPRDIRDTMSRAVAGRKPKRPVPGRRLEQEEYEKGFERYRKRE